MLKLAVLLLLLGQDPAVELTYRLTFPDGFQGDRAATSARTLELVRRRLAAFHPKASVKAGEETETLVVTATIGTLADVKKTLARPGTFAFHATADLDLQAAFLKDGKVPDGYRLWEHKLDRVGEYAEWAGGRLLLRAQPVVDQGHLIRVEAGPQRLPDRVMWVVNLEFNAEGAKRFDAAAKELYNRRPQGMIAIVVDGTIRSMPVVQSDKFGGRMYVSGQKDEAEARMTAGLLKLGALPVPLELVAERAAGK